MVTDPDRGHERPVPASPRNRSSDERHADRRESSPTGLGHRISTVETYRTAIQPNVLLLRATADDGCSGLGEAFYAAAAVEAYVHEALAPALFEIDEATPERVANAIRPYAGLGGGVETRAIGAIDVSLWDLLARHAGLTLATLLGGAVRQTIPVYNTCAGPGYVARTDRQQARNWGLSARGTNLEDLDAFLHRPAELASELLTEGFRAMKIWPFDRAAEATGGNAIGTRALSEGVGIVAAIRDAVGADMDIMVELHGLWNRPAAVEICEALAPYKPAWVEDPVRPASTDAFIKLAGEVAVPIAAGETCVGRTGFYPLLASGAIDVATVDIGWTGGLTEARKVASLADMFGIGLAPHDCTGPVMLATAVQLTLSQPNGLIQEVTRAFLGTWYRDLVEGLPPIDSGQIVAGDRPGHGVELKGNLADLPGVTHRVTSRT